MSNRLAKETSPYLLQHKDNPVDWYPWCSEAFARAAQEDKPIFLSIGYSACHWCHVLAHESFEDEEIAALLNKYFISIKVDKEERPDIDSVYMTVCQAFTGSGGWPTSIFMTAEQKPFFAGTYFPKTSRGNVIGLRELLTAIHEKWDSDRETLLHNAEEILKHLSSQKITSESTDIDLTHLAASQYRRSYDEKHGGFARAPKFPAPHNLLFLLDYYKRYKTPACLRMAEHTLTQMYRGGIFDHIGFGFCRYSTDKKFLVPHFEKMLYDNALLILAYCSAYSVTKKEIYLEIAEKTASYILREMRSPEGGFFSSQDADSEGEEGKYYLFTPGEIIGVLGPEDGENFNRQYDITEAGNFEGKNIPNLLKHGLPAEGLEPCLSALYDYRKKRIPPHRDEKILSSWNSLMIAALCALYLAGGKELYLSAAQNADRFIQKNLCDGDTLYVSFHRNKRGVRGFLDDYAAYIFAQLSLYRATLEDRYLERARRLCDSVIADFGDNAGGFYLYGKAHEELILRPKEIYDGAIPSGNSLMAYNLVRLFFITDAEKYKAAAQRQLDFLAQSAVQYPTNHAMFLIALMEHDKPPIKVTAVLDEQADKNRLLFALPPDAIILLKQPSKSYSLKNGKSTYYVCKGQSCLPPTNDLQEWL
ncbi:MAG: thioredoxin domain-containing protein [Oscillospiraceae bacterium]|nr:thioredoxin domain-containing protein [Oscillospiraceae bacterium]